MAGSSLLGDHPADGVAVDAGQVAVEHDDVVAVELQLGGGVEPVVGDVDGHALVSQALGDVVGEPPRVFDDQHPHRDPRSARETVAGGSVTADPQPSFVARLEFDRSAVGSGDGCDDRQAQPDPAVGAGALGAASPERPAQLADLGWVEDRAAVLDDESGGRALGRRS